MYNKLNPCKRVTQHMWACVKVCVRTAGISLLLIMKQSFCPSRLNRVTFTVRVILTPNNHKSLCFWFTWQEAAEQKMYSHQVILKRQGRCTVILYLKEQTINMFFTILILIRLWCESVGHYYELHVSCYGALWLQNNICYCRYTHTQLLLQPNFVHIHPFHTWQQLACH